MSYRKQQGYRKHGGKCGKRRRRSRKNDVRLPAVIMGTVLILILCGREILTVGIGGITGQAAESQAVGAAAAAVAATGREDNRAEQAHQVKNAQEQEWNLFLVNPWNPIPENYEPELTYLRNGQAVDSRCYPELQQMMDDCRAAGFVLRYPTDKSDITGIIYEPWHYRYVGKEAAAEMYENKLCLEEYLGIN